jgi:hypothetical protein
MLQQYMAMLPHSWAKFLVVRRPCCLCLIYAMLQQRIYCHAATVYGHAASFMGKVSGRKEAIPPFKWPCCLIDGRRFWYSKEAMLPLFDLCHAATT